MLTAMLKNLHGLQKFFLVFNNFTIESAKFLTMSADASEVSYAAPNSFSKTLR
jgi:hypothetical protein